MKTSVCSDMLFGKMPTHEAMKIIKNSGADGVEFWSADGKDIDAVSAASKELKLPVAAFCAPMEPALISPQAAKIFPEKLKKTADTCNKLNCRSLIALSGKPDSGWTPEKMHERLVSSVEAAIPVLEKNDLTLLLEPLNASEQSYLKSSHEAFDICRMLKSSRVKVLFDIYHMQYMEGNLINTITINMEHIGHIHIADLPGRTAPGLGEINFENIFKTLKKNGYNGYLGLEYIPSENAGEELKRSFALCGKEY